MEKVLIVPIVTKQTSRFSKYRLVRRRAQPGWKIQLKLNLMANAELLRFCRKLSPPGWVANCKRQHRSKGTNSIVVFQKQFLKGIFSKIETIIDDRDISLLDELATVTENKLINVLSEKCDFVKHRLGSALITDRRCLRHKLVASGF